VKRREDDIDQDLKQDRFPSMLSTGEAARAMRCSERNVWRHVEAGRLHRYGSARSALFRRVEVARLIARS